MATRNPPRKNRETYLAKLRDPRWQKKRLKILERDEWTCQICGDSESTLHVHHRRYIVGREPWEYHDGCLVTLCEGCHEFEGEDMREAIGCLIEMVKENLFAHDVHALAEAIHDNHKPSEGEAF